MPGFRGPNPYAGMAGADLENAPTGDVPFTSPIGIPVTRIQTWHAGGTVAGAQAGVPGRIIAPASGNPAVYTDPVVRSPKLPYGAEQGYTFTRRGSQQAADSMTNIGQANVPPDEVAPAFLSQFGSNRPLQQGQETAKRAPGNAPVGYSNDKLITYDRHAMMKVGYENSGRNSGNTDPPMDGPARPSLWLVQRTLNYQQGTDTTAATDDLERDYTRNSTGMYVGEQGTGWAPVYGGVPGLYQTYGSYAGISPSTPAYDPVTGHTQGIVSPAEQGQAGDGPHSVWSGPPHGLHSPTLPTYSQTLGRYMDIPQMARPRIDRPSNSPIAGQSYSQTVQSQGQTGFAPSQSRGNAGPRFNQRSRGNGWRGRAAG
jgi:hypothetical protein